MRWIGLVWVVGLVGCSAARSQDVSPSPTVITGGETTAQRLTLTVTVSVPSDLLVKQGDRVSAGQVLADRVRDRERIEARMERLQLQKQQVSVAIAGPPPVRPLPEVAGLPPTSFVDEIAQVERQRRLVEAAANEVSNQQRMLDMLVSMENPSLPAATIPHEEEVLGQRQQELAQAEAELAVAEGLLHQAEAERQYQEYQHSLEMSQRAIAIQQAELQRQEELQHQQAEERDRAFELAQLESQLQNLEAQLFTLSAIRSPYSGVIQRLKIQEQRDQNLIVELSLVADGGTGAGSPDP